MRTILSISLLSLALLSAPTVPAAQEAETAAQQPEPAARQDLLTIELNRVQQSQDGCRLSFMAVNELGANLVRTAVEIVLFDGDSIVSQMLLLDFGRLPNDKTKVVEFDLPQQCEQISRVLLNDIVECSTANEQNMTEACFDGLRTSNRAAIQFGV